MRLTAIAAEGLGHPEPTPRERQILLAMAASDCSQVAIADVLNVPRTRIRIWYRRMW